VFDDVMKSEKKRNFDDFGRGRKRAKKGLFLRVPGDL
jgi:hypothetical protein